MRNMAQGNHPKLRESRMSKRELAERNVNIWTDWIGGHTVEQLSLKYDVSDVGMYQIIKKLKAKYGALNEVDADSMRQRLIDQALGVMKTLSDLMNADPIPAYSNGKPILDADGNIAWDHTTRLNAARTLLVANKRLAELTGADAAQQIDITVTQQAQEQASNAAAAALARVFATVTDVPAIEATRADLVIEAETLLAQEDTAL